MFQAFCDGFLAQQYCSSGSCIEKTSYTCGRGVGFLPILAYAVVGKILELAITVGKYAMLGASALAAFALFFKMDNLRDPWYVHQKNLTIPMVAIIALVPLIIYGERLCDSLGIERAWQTTKNNCAAFAGR